MATLENFLRSGQLGPVFLGMTPADVITLAGDPDETSRKSKPLLLTYGSVEFLFSKSPQDPAHLLRQIAITYGPNFELPPQSLTFSDWIDPLPPSESDFRAFINAIDYLPAQSLEGATVSRLIFLSGVVVLLADETVTSMRIDSRARNKPAAGPLSHEQEPRPEEILAMFEEANRALRAGADRGALLIAWAGLEAALRYRAVRVRPFAKVRMQPAFLINELFSAAQLDVSEHRALEGLRQLRTTVAHGLAPVKFDTHTIEQMRALAVRLLGAAFSSQ